MKENFSTKKITVPIDKVSPNKYNPNVQSKVVYEKEIESIKKYGLMGSILVHKLVDDTYEIVDGEHRWKACKELGYKNITVENLGELSEPDLKILTVLLNNLRGKDDIEKRAKLYSELNEGQLQLLPFTKEEIENEKKFFDFDFSQYDKEEVVKERRPSYTLLLNLTADEKGLWDSTYKIAKEKGFTEVSMLIKMIEIFLELHGKN